MIFTFPLLFIFSICTLISREVPQVVDNKIYFLDGKNKIELGENDYYHIFPQKNCLIYINHQVKQNYREYILEFYDFKGKKIAQPEMITGQMRFIFSETNERILAGQRAALTRQNESYLYNLDGKLINVLNHDFETKRIGITENEKYFWFAANKMRPLNPGEKPFLPNNMYTPYNRILIFDVVTGNLLADYSTQEANFDFFMDEKKYTISVGPPDIPG